MAQKNKETQEQKKELNVGILVTAPQCAFDSNIAGCLLTQGIPLRYS